MLLKSCSSLFMLIKVIIARGIGIFYELIKIDIYYKYYKIKLNCNETRGDFGIKKELVNIFMM
ncbi:hypothetical protein JPSP49_12350 [Staphylococcus pseudintermedius]